MRESIKKNMKVRSIFLIICSLFCAHLGYSATVANICTTVGATQDKYTASGCSYTTQTRTCCSSKLWSDWGEACPSCTSSQCWNGTTCVNKGSVSTSCSSRILNSRGTLTRTATCINGVGWSYGEWTGTCTCNSGYTWNESTSTCDANVKEYQWLWTATFGYSQCDGSSNCLQSSVACCTSAQTNNTNPESCTEAQAGLTSGRCLTREAGGTCYVRKCTYKGLSGNGSVPITPMDPEAPILE